VAEGQNERSILIRPLVGIEELDQAVQLQKIIWGFVDIELLPLRLFVVAQKVGGQTLGAFDGRRMVGFLLSIPGLKPGGVNYLHSHMMGVLEGYRNLGVGRRLKLYQRELALKLGIGLVEWTFDPLELKNAFFNIERLGAVVRRFVFNQYGTTTSHLHGGLPTDRCVAEWYLAGDRARAVVESREFEHGEVLHRIEYPVNIGEIRANEPRRARQIQAAGAEQFQHYFDQDLAVIGFESTPEKGTYLIGPWNFR
jgi:predicted GNAT superfamily acetyltransferase